MAKTFDDAVELESVAFAQPFDGAYGITDCSRCVKIVLDGYCVHCVRRECESGEWVPMGRKESTNGHRRLCIENALKWVDA